MKFDIEILSVSTETKTGPKSTYVMIDVAFKNLTQGKTEGKKFFPFGNSMAAYTALKDAKPGNQFTVTSEKGEQYWEWIEVVAKPPGTVQGTVGSINKAVTAPKSTYETPEERAKKQVYIVKQSSISNAISVLSIGAKTPPSSAQVLDLAQDFTSWVLAEQSVPLVDMMSDDIEVV